MATTNLDLYRRGQTPVLPQSQAKFLQDELRKLEKQAAGQFDRFEIVDKDIAGTKASIEQEIIVRADADEAIASMVTTLEATVTQNDTDVKALITQEATARSTADTVLATQITSLSATVDTNASNAAAAVSNEATARATADTALATDITNLSATVSTNLANTNASINAEATARATADTALATDITNLSATVNSNNTTVTAAISNEATARATADSALASDISTLSTTVGGHTTTISSHSTSINGIEGRYGVTIDNNGHISGFSLLSGAGGSSVFRIVADRFALRKPGTSEDALYWDAATGKLVVRGDIEASSVIADSVTTAGSVNIGNTSNILPTNSTSGIQAVWTATGALPFTLSGGKVLLTGDTLIAPWLAPSKLVYLNVVVQWQILDRATNDIVERVVTHHTNVNKGRTNFTLPSSKVLIDINPGSWNVEVLVIITGNYLDGTTYNASLTGSDYFTANSQIGVLEIKG